VETTTPTCASATALNGIAFAAALHVASTLDMLPGRLLAAEPLLEMDRSENPLRDRLTLPRFQIRHGKVAVPTAPGLGVHVDDNQLREYQVG
jgi:D-galactarolactone cycloisomerase